MDVTKPYNVIWFCDIHGPKPYKFIGFGWAFISQTPVASFKTSSREGVGGDVQQRALPRDSLAIQSFSAKLGPGSPLYPPAR